MREYDADTIIDCLTSYLDQSGMPCEESGRVLFLVKQILVSSAPLADLAEVIKACSLTSDALGYHAVSVKLWDVAYAVNAAIPR